LPGPIVVSSPRPDWSPLPNEGCRNVESKLLLTNNTIAIAMLRFGANGTIHEHASGWDIDVICLEGAGMTSVDGKTEALGEGQSVRWPAGTQHRLWTVEQTMVTLMIEHVGAS
jgi:quercetin dioxygenase-like cupin family protein